MFEWGCDRPVRVRHAKGCAGFGLPAGRVGYGFKRCRLAIVMPESNVPTMPTNP